MINVLVDGNVVASVPFWMAHHVIDDALTAYSSSGRKICFEVIL